MDNYDDDPLTLFEDALSNALTRDRYEKRLAQFFKFSNLEGETLQSKAHTYTIRAKNNPTWAVSAVMTYMRHQKQRAENGEISTATLSNYYKPIKLFCEMNDIILNWKKITRGIPKGKAYASDRIPTLDEIKKLLRYPDRRLKPAILIMMSSGIRVGAWDYLRSGDIQPIYDDNDNLIAAKLLVYRGEPEEYRTFITPEAYDAVKEYVDFRSNHGESITERSWVLRDEFDVSKASKGIASIPKQLKSSGLKRLIERALFAQGIRKPLQGTRRHEFQADHGFRKYFKTIAEQQMKSLHVELLMGHSVGLSDNYYRIPEKDLLMEYLKSVPDLSVSSSAMTSNDERISNLEEEVKTLKLGIESYLAKLKFRGNIDYDDEEIQKYFTAPKKHIHAKLTRIRYGNNKELVF